MHFLKDIYNSIGMIMKLLVFVGAVAIFLSVFNMLTASAVAYSIVVTFFVVWFSCLNKNKLISARTTIEVCKSVISPVFVADIVAYVQLNILLENGMYGFVSGLIKLFFVFLVQAFAIFAISFIWMVIYRKLHKRERCIVIVDEKSNVNSIMYKLKKYKKLYKIKRVTEYNQEVYDIIDEMDSVFMFELPPTLRANIINYCFKKGKNVYYDFDISDVIMLNRSLISLDDKLMVACRCTDLTVGQRIIKRTSDIIISLIAIVLSSPIMLACAIAIKSEDGGRVFFRQERATKDGKIFSICKFRTMKEENAINKSVVANDDRITKVGNILRRFRIDELPQLFNILMGDMSVVGPRPEMMENVIKYTQQLPEFEYRLRVKAGLTGLAQILGKYNTSPRDKLMLDLKYVQEYSFYNDIKLMFKTIEVFFKSSESTQAFVIEE